MVTQDQVREALRSVNDPEIGRPIEDIGMLRDIEVLDGGLVRVHVLITIEGCPLKDRITSDVTEALAPLEGVERVDGLPVPDERGAARLAGLAPCGAARPPAAAADLLRRLRHHGRSPWRRARAASASRASP